MPQVDLVNDPSVYFEKLTLDREEMTSVYYVSEDFFEMQWEMERDFVDCNSNINVAQARLKLYSYLEQPGSRGLYADTKSIIFNTTKGDILGDLTDEVPNIKILAFVTDGTKMYALKFRLQKPDKDGNLTIF
jgi:hypothetical protein